MEIMVQVACDCVFWTGVRRFFPSKHPVGEGLQLRRLFRTLEFTLAEPSRCLGTMEEWGAGSCLETLSCRDLSLG